jgi:lactoylglutathione lyase
MRVNFVIVFVSDMKASVAFYRDVIGLPLRFESPEWTEFATEGATLALHAGGHGQAGTCRPGLEVLNLDEFHARMLAANVRCIQEPKVVFGARIAQYADPDGVTYSVSVPSGR